MVTCWERAYLLALMCVMFSCVLGTFPHGVLGQVWYLIVSISDLCLLPNLNSMFMKTCFSSLKTSTMENESYSDIEHIHIQLKS